MAFNRDRNSSRPSFSSGGDRGGFRPRFNDRGPSRGPVEMHDAICDNCGKSCQVPFRPTSGKPIYCSSCFESQRGGSDSPRFAGGAGGRFERRDSGRSEERQMFDAVCADCGDKCSVPFQPSSDKPVYCSNCFGEKKNSGGNGGGKDQFAELNSKLDKIIMLLSNTSKEVISEAPVEIETPKKKSKAPKKPAKV